MHVYSASSQLTAGLWVLLQTKHLALQPKPGAQDVYLWSGWLHISGPHGLSCKSRQVQEMPMTARRTCAVVCLTFWNRVQGIQTGTIFQPHSKKAANRACTWMGQSKPTCSQSQQTETGWDWGGLGEGLELMCREFLFQGHPWHFMRPLGTGNGAKQELEQLRVNVNPSSHKQLKIILTSEEGDGVGSSESTFFSYLFGAVTLLLPWIPWTLLYN